MRRRQTDIPVLFAHYDPTTRKIEGLYNSLRHDNIPEPKVEISESLRDSIVRNPTKYIVDSDKQQVVEQKLPDVSEARPENDKLEKGIPHNGVCFAVDLKSRAHLLECLTLTTFDPKAKFKVLAYSEGKPVTRKIGRDDLLFIMKKLNRAHVEYIETLKESENER